jgi:hypothetical protein
MKLYHLPKGRTCVSRMIRVTNADYLPTNCQSVGRQGVYCVVGKDLLFGIF